MTNVDSQYDQSAAHERSFVGQILLEYVAVLAFIVVIGAVAVAEMGGAFDTLIHEIRIVG
jgi:hypothetical protein